MPLDSPPLPHVASAAAISDFAQRRYHAYPHANGFADGGAAIVLGQLDDAGTSLWKIDLQSGRETLIARFAAPRAPAFKPELWFDVALSANILATVSDGAIWLFDLSSPSPGRMLFRQSGTMVLSTLLSITPDASRVVAHFQQDTQYGILTIDLATGRAEIPVRHNWWIGHTHFLPHDPQWILYCHEGRCDTVPDRMWAWHPQHAPRGRPIFDQASGTPGVLLQVGHEVGCSHDPSVIAVAYGASPAGPRGVYQIFLDGRAPRLISQANRDLHCNISRDGRWILVDTSGPHDAPGRGWEESRAMSDILLIHPTTGRRRLLARSGIRNHPWHPHPVFSPDARTAIYAEAREDTGRVHLLRLAGAEP